MTLIFLIIVFAIVGIGVYALDLWFIGIFSKKKLAEGTAKGMLVGRTVRAKLIVAAVLIALRTYFAIKAGHTDFMWDVVYGVVIYVSLIIGFYLAPRTIKAFPSKMRSTLKYLEGLESGKIDPLKNLKDFKNKKVEEVKEKVEEKVVETIIEEIVPEKKEEVKSERELTIEEQIEKYKNS